MLTRALLVVALVSALGCAPVVDHAIEDAALTAAVTTALLNSPEIDGTLVTVRSDAGVIHIEGTQPSAAAAAAVVDVVRRVNGVRDVQSAVVVSATPAPGPASISAPASPEIAPPPR